MKANDLRIGNLVNTVVTNEIYAVDLWALSVIKGGNYQNSHDTNTKVFKPIELTKEWLLKFGFEKKYDDLNWYIKGNYCFSFLKELDLIVFKIKFQTIGICTIKYVHEAQNIYFALTGEELSYDTK